MAGDRAAAGHGGAAGDEEVKEPPLWTQLFRPDQPTARLLLRTGIPLLAVVDGSFQAQENRQLFFHVTGKYGEKPQSFFQTMLPFLRTPTVVDKPPAPPPDEPKRPDPPPGDTPPKPAEPKGQGADTTAAVSNGLPLVGIYHTHDWESYISEFPADFQTTNLKSREDLWQVASFDHSKRTVVGLGNTLAVELKKLGITTVHAPFTHQDLGYNYAYRSSRNTAKEILKEAPSTKILIDLHRDDSGNKVTVQGKKAAPIRCIIGNDAQPNWEKNRNFCDKLIARVEKDFPGLTLPTRIQSDTYNQDMLPGAILLEIGGAMNSYAEAEQSVKFLAKTLAAMIREGEYPK